MTPPLRRSVAFAAEIHELRKRFNDRMAQMAASVPAIPRPQDMPDKDPKYAYATRPPGNLTYVAIVAAFLVDRQSTDLLRHFEMSWPEYEFFVDYRWRGTPGYVPTLQRVGYTAGDFARTRPKPYDDGVRALTVHLTRETQ